MGMVQNPCWHLLFVSSRSFYFILFFVLPFRANCTQIPKLRVACASSVNGHRTMWSHCEQCGAISMVEWLKLHYWPFLAPSMEKPVPYLDPTTLRHLFFSSTSSLYALLLLSRSSCTISLPGFLFPTRLVSDPTGRHHQLLTIEISTRASTATCLFPPPSTKNNQLNNNNNNNIPNKKIGYSQKF